VFHLLRVGAETGICLLLLHCIDYTFENVYCDLIFKCGCTWNWAGGWDQCNVHDEDLPWSLRCPFCSAPHYGKLAVWLTKYYLWSLLTFLGLCLLDVPYHKKLAQYESLIFSDQSSSDVQVDEENFLESKGEEESKDLFPHWEEWWKLRLLAFVIRLLIVCSLYPVYGAITGLGFKLYTGYPVFFVQW